MGTILKYLFYIALIATIYVVVKDVMNGKITEKTTIGQALSDVDSGVNEIVEDNFEKLNSDVDKVDDAKMNEIKINEPEKGSDIK